MSLAEKIYLSMVLFMFFSFMVLIATVSWLDAKETRVARRRDQEGGAAAKSGDFIAGNTVHQH